MEVLLALVIVVLAIGALILPWIQRGQIETLKADVAKMRAQLAQVREQMARLTVPAAVQPEAEAPSVSDEIAVPPEAMEPVAEDRVVAPEPVQEVMAETAHVEPAFALPRAEEVEATQDEAPVLEAPSPPPPPPPARPKISWEQQIGARLPVWVGGIALALSGIFLVKYSIDSGLLSPAVRCALAGMMGVAMLGGAQFVAWRGAIANGVRIAQALSGAGIAVLYGTVYAAATVYGFISPGFAFASMAGITALAVFLSLRHGQAIALLGMVGGFLTPALIDSREPNAAVLFGYLAALTIGLFVVVRRENWWWLGWPTLAAAFLWVIIWLAGGGTPGDGLWVGLFLLVIGATAFSFIGPHADEKGQAAHAFAWLGLILTGAAAVFLMCVVLVRSQFGATEWGLYGALAAGAIGLAAWEHDRYRYLPWMTMAASAVLFAVWVTPATEFFALVLFLFTLLFSASGLVMLWRARDPLDWGGLACASALIFYLIGYGRLREVTDAAQVLAPDTVIGSWPVWGIIALIFATIATLVAGRIAERRGTSDAVAQKLLAQFSLTATAFLSLGLAVEFARPALAIAIAGQTLAVAWINTRVDIRILRWIVGGLGAVFVWLMLPQVEEPLNFAIRMTLGLSAAGVVSVPLALHPLLHLGVPSVLFGLASYFLLRQRDDRMVRVFECGTAGLLGATGYYVIRHFNVPAEEVLSSPGTPFEGGFISQVLLAYAIALATAGRSLARSALVASGVVAAAIAIARVVHFDIQPAQLMGAWLPMAFGRVSEVITSLPISEQPIFHLGVPAVLLMLFRLTLGFERDDWLVRLGEYIAVVLFGLMGYFLIRHAFVPVEQSLTALGSRFEGGIISQAQIVYAIGLVFAARFFGRVSLVHAAVAAGAIAVARIVVFDAQPLLLLGTAIQMSMGTAADPSLTVPIAASPLFHLGLPAVLLSALGFVLSKGRGANVAPYFEYAAITFAAFMVYYLIRHAFNPAELAFSSPGTYLERGVLTNALLMFGLALYAGGQALRRQTLLVSGVVVAAFSVVRIVFFDVLTSSPLVAAHDVGGLPVVNALLLPYGLPVIWLTLLAGVLGRRGRTDLATIAGGAALLFSFFWISLNVRQVFQGAVLNAPAASNGEVYSYSVAWLVLGVGLLVAGAARQDRVMRIASLAVMVLTVGKVFLYDASELEGLLRVVSFLGLGLSLLGLSWFYTRYVFVREAPTGPSHSI